jgi:hypothetical protein
MKRFSIAVCLIVMACQPTKPTPRGGEANLRVVETTQSLAAAPAETESPDQPVVGPAGTFAFGDDSSGRILGRVLPPTEPARLAVDSRTSPKPRGELPGLERPEIPTAPPATSLPKLPPPKRQPLRPRGLPEATPLGDMIEDITTPERPELPAGKRIRTPSRDVNLPVDLPMQARYQPDRAPFDDPTADLSLEKANAQAPPLRTTPAPFVRMNLPEPFEHRAVVRTAAPAPPVVTPVPTPPK